VVMKSPVFWDITRCSPFKIHQSFGGTGCIHLATHFMLVPFLAYSSTLRVEATCSSEMSVDFQWTTLRYIAEDRTLEFYSVSQTREPSCRVGDTESRRMRFV
jgi:hypothetical protein